MHRLLHRPDIVPVGGSGVHLVPGAAVDGHGGRTGLLHGLCKLHAVDGALVPAQAELHRHRALCPPDHRFGHPHRLGRVTHQAGAVPGVCHFGHGAAHIDVDDVRPGNFGGDGRPLLHAHGVAAEDLGGGGVLPLPQLQQGHGLFVLKAQGLGADHLRAGQPRPLLPADSPEGRIRHPRHGGQGQGRFN